VTVCGMRRSKSLSTVLLAVAVFSVVAFPGSAAASGKTRKSCFTVSEKARTTPSAAFRSKYSLSVTAKYCLSYTKVTSKGYPSVSAVEETLTVAHSGAVPVKDGLPVFDVAAVQIAVGPYAQEIRWNSDRGAFVVSEPDSSARFGDVKALLGDLVGKGFRCDESRCRASKRSVSSVVVRNVPGPITGQLDGMSRNDVPALIKNAGGKSYRMFFGSFALLGLPGGGPIRTSYQGVYWDVATICVSFDGCTATVKPARSFTKFDVVNGSATGHIFGLPRDLVVW
jgi:hypothetical protein